MDNRLNKRLNKEDSALSINLDSQININFENNNKIIPENEINHIVNEAKQFDTERQNTTKYRILGTIKPMVQNTLINPTDTNGLSVFEDLKFRDETSIGGKMLRYADSFKNNLIEIDGWWGYFEPNHSGYTTSNPCVFIDMEPNRRLFSMVDGVNKNWEVMITYPFLSDTSHFLVNGGLKLIESRMIVVGGKELLALITPVKHGLTSGDKVVLYSLGSYASSSGDTYEVQITGLQDGTMGEYAFAIDVGPTVLTPNSVNILSRMRRLVDTNKSNYYFRLFKRITYKNDYELYNLNFSQNWYNDMISQFVFNTSESGTTDIDVSRYVDNLGRPLSELYVTLVKNDPLNKFTKIQSGVEMPYFEALTLDLSIGGIYLDVSDIHRIHDDKTIILPGNYVPISHNSIESDIKIDDNIFYGDIVEYNEGELLENVLGEVYHRFNTDNRISGVTFTLTGDKTGLNDNPTPTYMGKRQEGYYYKAHYKIQIRDYSSYIETAPTGQTSQQVGDEVLNVGYTNIPDYAIIFDGDYAWRDLLDIGFSDSGPNSGVDYPFLNGFHYIHQNYLTNIRRQDPFGKYSLYYKDFPKDPYGFKLSDDKYYINTTDNAC